MHEWVKTCVMSYGNLPQPRMRFPEPPNPVVIASTRQASKVANFAQVYGRATQRQIINLDYEAVEMRMASFMESTGAVVPLEKFPVWECSRCGQRFSSKDPPPRVKYRPIPVQARFTVLFLDEDTGVPDCDNLIAQELIAS